MAVLFVVNVGVGVWRTTSLRTVHKDSTLPLSHITPKFCIVAMFAAGDFYKSFIVSLADVGCRAVYGVGLRRLACWGCGFESRRGHGCLSSVCVL